MNSARPALTACRRLRVTAAAMLAIGMTLVARATVLKGPYVLLEDATVLRIRFEVDQPGYVVNVHHDGGERSTVPTSFKRSPRDTFLADAVVRLSPQRP